MLSPIEKACLRWSSQGKNVSDIALLAGRSVAEIELHLSNASASLGAVSLIDAVEKAKSSQEVTKGGAKKSKPVDAEVGARIRSRRRSIGLSQRELGEALGVTFQQVQKYEKGTNRVGASRLQVIANLLGVPIEYFFGGKAGQSTGTAKHTHLIADHDLMAFLQTTEARELSATFSKVKSPAVRKRIVVLVQAIASTFPRGTSEAK